MLYMYTLIKNRQKKAQSHTSIDATFDVQFSADFRASVNCATDGVKTENMDDSSTIAFTFAIFAGGLPYTRVIAV